jgi:hypothetical protein
MQNKNVSVKRVTTANTAETAYAERVTMCFARTLSNKAMQSEVLLYRNDDDAQVTQEKVAKAAEDCTLTQNSH